MDIWNAIHAERTKLANALNQLDRAQWTARSLCPKWTVEQVVAHLSAVANTGTLAWLRSIMRAGFDADKHNARLLTRYLGDDYIDTFKRYRRSIPLTIAPTKNYAALLGEIIVHSQDIAQPLGLRLTPMPESVAEVANFYAAKDFAVNSKTLVRDLQLQATDATFASGNGPLVRGSLLDLVMIMAGRQNCIENLDGDGVAELRRRLGLPVAKR